MFKIPKLEYTAEFKELAVKRMEDGQGVAIGQPMIFLLFLGFLTSCSADPNEKGNRIFVEVQQLIETAEKQSPEERLRSLRAADKKLKSIVSSYPSANLAVQLASGQSIGRISLRNMS